MAFSILNTLKTLPPNFWFVLAGFLGFSSITTPIAIAFLIVNSASFQYKAGDTEISLKGKELTTINRATTALLQKQIEQQNQAILELSEAAKQKNLDKKLPELQKVEQAAVESELRLNDVQTSQQKLDSYIQTIAR